ncbi:LysR family transcriptional regulator [Yoonia litorea]|uniref:DNA-binding transcriptional regulator, LysR family n=1 Tax=Yoonia litorea TaxID=1123755 RepID=A0A1I6MTM5_9RHOB|nr:LysR family transcriptional regulator [Yoonia litorea]SFS19009.1 DNA-binding transcriptional regulator, LysR family [Yoonia litorea]
MNFRNFDLNLLRVLDALLLERSTVKAGHRIGLSQPAVSAALRRLREATGDALLVRSGQGMIPTDYALEIELPLRLFLGDIERLLSAHQRFDPAEADFAFKIAGSDFYGEFMLPPLVERLQRTAPNVKVQLVDLVVDSHLASLQQYSVDMAMVPKTTLPDWVEGQAVFHSDFAVVASKENARIAHAGLQPGQKVPMDLFCDLGHVLYSPQGNLKAMGDAALERVGRKRRVVMTVPTFSAVWRNVLQTDAVAILPEQLAHKIAGEAELDVFWPPVPVDRVQINMIWHKRFTGSPAHRWMRGLIAEVMAPLNEGYPPLGDI